MVFVKGQSGNPSGRPKRDWSWGKLLEEVGEQVEAKSGKKFRELVGLRLWAEAANGNVMAIKEIMNRMDGMPKQGLELGGVDGDPIKVEQAASKEMVEAFTKFVYATNRENNTKRSGGKSNKG